MIGRAAAAVSLRNRRRKLRLFFELIQPTPETQPATASEPAATSEAFAAGDTAAVRPGAVYTAPPRPSRPATDLLAVTTAFGAGGVVALLGVAVGYALARRRTR